MERRNNHTWNWCRFITSFLRIERGTLILLCTSMFRDNFKSEYGDKAWIIWIAHLIGIVICIFADVIKARINNSNFKVSKDGVEITQNGITTK
jgi:hypothetical protein